MADDRQSDFGEYLRAVQARMLRHTVDHLPAAVDSRTAMIMLKNGLFRIPPKNPIPERLVRAVEFPWHPLRWPGRSGPLVVMREGRRRRTVIELATMLLNPEQRVRRAALSELDRQMRSHQQLVSPGTARRLAELRVAILSTGPELSLSAAVEAHDLLSGDHFYNLQGVHQCADLRIDEELPKYLGRVLSPDERSIDFLLKLPIWSPRRQQAELRRAFEGIVTSHDSLQEVLEEYYRLFGHLPLASTGSAAGAAAAWRGRHSDPADPWGEVWAWAEANGSVLAQYHACQLLLGTPDWVPPERQPVLWQRIAEVVEGPSRDDRWRVRSELARLYCQRLECLAPGADGDRAAAYSWWQAEMLASTLDLLGDNARKLCMRQINEAARVSEEVWSIGRPRSMPSTLRYATLFSASLWTTSLLCELSRAGLRNTDLSSGAVRVLAEALCKPAYAGVDRGIDEARGGFAFEGSTLRLGGSLLERGLDPDAGEQLRSIQETLRSSREQGMGASLRASAGIGTRSVLIAHELRAAVYCGEDISATLRERFTDPEWRRNLLVGGEEASLELVCNAAVESAIQEQGGDWRSQLPHFFALACEDLSAEPSRRRLLFGFTVVASAATDTVSGIVRLVGGEHRNDYQEMVAAWRERIERVVPLASPWIAARLRAIKCALHV